MTLRIGQMQPHDGHIEYFLAQDSVYIQTPDGAVYELEFEQFRDEENGQFVYKGRGLLCVRAVASPNHEGSMIVTPSSANVIYVGVERRFYSSAGK